MVHRIARVCVALAATLALSLPAPALAHDGDSAPSPSTGAMDGHDMTGHDTAGTEDHDMGSMNEGDTGRDGGSHGSHEGATTHDPAARSDHTDHEQTGDTVSPQMRALVLTGFGSVNGAVVVAAFLIRRQRPTRSRGARR